MQKIGKDYDTDKYKTYVLPGEGLVILKMEFEDKHIDWYVSLDELPKDKEGCILQIEVYWDGIRRKFVEEMTKQALGFDGPHNLNNYGEIRWKQH